DWINWRRTLDGWGYSPLDRIDTENAHRLQLAWSWAIGTEGRPEPNPLVYDGVLYIASPFGIVEALDAASGELLWRYRHEHEAEELTGIVTTRNLAIYDDKVYLTTVDAHVVALDARTGDVVWNVAGADYRLGFRYTAGPIVVVGRVVASTNGCERFHEAKDMPCFISARDAQTGEEVWRTSTVARPGEPGGDTWGDTPLMFRIGGDSWTAGSYDPDTNLIYWATAQAKPWARFQRGHSGDALYTNSVLALDPASGEIVWYNQLLPGETHDMDETFENLLVDHDGRRSLFKMGKLAILWELDRATGRFLAAHDLGYQTILDVHPETGAITYRPGMIPQEGVELEFCPSVAGFKSWRSMAYHPDTQAFYVPLLVSCERTTFGPGPELVEGGGGVGISRRAHLMHPERPDGVGELVAIDVDGNLLWRHRTRTAMDSAVLTTGGGLVVVGDWDRNLYVHDARSGEILFRTRMPSSVSGFPITYAVEGRQYLAIPVGTDPSLLSGISGQLTPEKRRPAGGHGIFVFTVADEAP
ncbi:MAG: PQQ-binding-like beta-propeller repeat protein, partial [Acidobacteriota bacterium]|nr:PQQ-binding-like beta-propeller repeat protein [Acidobacteriota bacterium]